MSAGDSYVQAEDVRQALHTNLLLLGFDQQTAEVKYKVSFNRDMFVLPNKKAFEVVAYFLFTRLDATRCREQFRACWPVFEKGHEAAFRKGCVEWLVQVTKDDPDAHLPRISQALFMMPGGDKFYTFMHSFSTYVLFQIMKRELGLKSSEHLLHPVLTPRNLEMAEVMVKTIQCGTVRHRTRTLEHMQTTEGVRETWHTYATELTAEYRELAKKVRDRQEDMHHLLRLRKDKGFKTPGRRCAGSIGVASSRLSQYSLDADSAKRAELAHKTRELWKAVDKYFTSKVTEKEIVESVVQEMSTMRLRLDAADLKVAVPDLLLRKCEKELSRRNVSNLFKGGKIDLLSLLHLWNLSLHLYYEKCHDGGLLDSRDATTRLQKKVHVHNAEVKNLQALRSRLVTSIIPDLKSSIETACKKLDETLFREDGTSPRHNNVGFEMQSYTPGAALMGRLDASEVQQSPDLQDTVTRRLDLSFTPGTTRTAARTSSQPATEVSASRPSLLSQGSPAAFNPIACLSYEVRADGTAPTVPDVSGHESSKLSADHLASVSRTAATQRVEPHRSKPTRLPRPTAEQSADAASAAAAAAAGPSALKARRQLAHQVVSRVYGGSASRSSKPSGRTSKKPVLSSVVAPIKDKVSGKLPHATAATASTERARLALADKIVERVLADDGEEDDNEEQLADRAPRMSLSPSEELSERAFLSREKIMRTPPKDIYAHTVERVAISEDDEDVEILTVDGRNDGPRTSETESRRRSAYAESFRAYLRDNDVFGLHTGRQTAILPPDGELAMHSEAIGSGGTVFGDRAFEKCSVSPAQTGRAQPVLTVRHAESVLQDPSVSSKSAETIQGAREGSATVASSGFDHEQTSSLAMPGGVAADSTVQVNNKETVKWAYRTATKEGGRQTPLASEPIVLTSTHPEDASDFAESKARSEPNASGKHLDQLADETPRSVKFITRAPPVPPPASSMARLSLTPSSKDSSYLGSPRNAELNDDHSATDSVEEVCEEGLHGSTTTDHPSIAIDRSPTTEDLFKRLQELKLQAALSLAGGTLLGGNNSLTGDSHLEGVLVSEKSLLFDEDASLLNESLGLSASPSISSPPQR